MNHKTIHFVGYASGIGGADPRGGEGPLVMQKSPYLSVLTDAGIHLEWGPMLKPSEGPSKLEVIKQACKKLAIEVKDLVSKKQFFTVLGGDHSSAIGTWSGARAAMKEQDSLGLIWFDAHMDSHTPETSHTGNIHGMPLACLLGHGEKSLTHLLSSGPQIKPEHICLIGVRSYEQGEADLLKHLNVRVFFMDEVKERGLRAVFEEALSIVTKKTTHFGVSLDLDSIDPLDAPGTGVAEPNGIKADDLRQVLPLLARQKNLLGLEIVEFDPFRDKNHLTEKLIIELIHLVAGNKNN